MKILSTSRRGPIELVRDTDKITVNEASAYLRLAEQKLECDSLTPVQFRFGASGLLKDIHNTLDA